MYSASSGTPLNTHHHYYSPVQCLHIGKTCTLHCRNRPKLCSIQVASKLVQTPNLVDISTVIIAIRHNAKLNYLNRNITKDALNFYAVNPRKWWREVKKKLTGQSVNEPFAALIHTSYDSESAISSIFATMLMTFSNLFLMTFNLLIRA